MKVKITPGKVGGAISAPASKSYTHRAIIIAALARGISVIKHPLISDDTKATIEACRKLGVKINANNEYLEIKGVSGKFPKIDGPINIFCGLSGTTARVITAVASLSPNKVVIDGEQRLRERPMKDLFFSLKEMGVHLHSTNNFLPATVLGGNIKDGSVSVPGNVSSQFVSALLLISPFAQKDTTVNANNLKSKPYVDITVDLMKTFGINVKVTKNQYFIRSGQSYKSRNYTVEGDYSSASYFFAAEFITNSKLTVDNLNPDSVQGDKYFLEIINAMKNNKTKRLFDLGNYPDIVPTVAVCAANLPGMTEINNIGHLRGKETDRIAAVATELRKMNVKVREGKDALVIFGGKLKAAEIDTYNDHRIAMSFAVAGLKAVGETIINNAEVVNKSYPNFWKDLKKIGAKIKIIN